ncbi:MAG TPA: transcriptional regulator CdaR, partial [Thermoanaerobacterales bacterium]|nr:transcriptional regulator CdaR [Thermoanaerobacterales bacterium]
MEITHAYAQNIVEKTIKILGRNINIMNSLGIIVGSGDKKRIDTYHQGAAEIIKTGEAMEITTEQANGLEGAKPGVNLPIFLNERIVGVVGITGEPEEVRPFGQLLKISVETMLKQFYLSEQLRMEQNAKELYISDILNGNFQEGIEMFITKGEVLGYNMSLPRIALVIKIHDFDGSQNRDTMKLEDKIELVEQKRREKILNCIKIAFNNPQHMISYSGSSTYVVLFVIKKGNIGIVKKQLREIVKVFREKVERYSTNYRIGVGSYYPELAGLRRSYKEAIKAIQILDKKSVDEKLPELVFASDMSLEMMLANTPEEIIQIYKSQVIAKDGAEDFLNDIKLIKTLNAYFWSNMNISRTAEELKV